LRRPAGIGSGSGDSSVGSIAIGGGSFAISSDGGAAIGGGYGANGAASVSSISIQNGTFDLKSWTAAGVGSGSCDRGRSAVDAVYIANGRFAIGAGCASLFGGSSAVGSVRTGGGVFDLAASAGAGGRLRVCVARGLNGRRGDDRRRQLHRPGD
jgi:hypothetical protein